MTGLEIVLIDRVKRCFAGCIPASLLVLVTMLCESHALATEPAAPATAYRQVFVPADRQDVWPTHGEAYFPVDPTQLRDLLNRANTRTGEAHSSPPHATEAVYYARYDGNRLIDGQACIVISGIPDQRKLIEWTATGIMLRDPRWKDLPETPVKLGAWGTDDAGILRTGLQAEQPGTLLFGFQAAAATKSEDASQFEIGSPRALRRRLYLDLPENYELTAEGGSIELLKSPARSVVGSEGPLMELPPLGLRYRRWLATNGPGDTLPIRIKHPPRTGGVRSDAPVYREQLTYFLRPQGMELVAELELLDGRKLPAELTIELDSPLKLVHAEWQGAAISWHEQSSTMAGPARYRLTLPGGARDHRPRLRLQAWRDLPRGELRRLPLLLVSDLFWSEGLLEINLADGLQLVDLRTGGLSPIVMTTSDENSTSRRWQFVKQRQLATAEVAVRDGVDPVDASIGTSLELSSASTKAVIRMQLRTTGHSLPPRIEAEVLGGWEIDSVESSSAVGFTDWYIDQADGKRMLRMLFREPGDATYPGEVVIEAHLKRSVAAESFSLAELMPFDWGALEPRRHMLAITVIGPLDLQMMGKVSRLTFDDLTDQDWELLQNSDVAALVLIGEADLDAQLKLHPERAAFSAATDIIVHLERGVVRQESTTHMEAARNPLQVQVMLSPAPATEIRWTDLRTGARLPATRVASTAGTLDADIWEVQLSRGDSRGQAFLASWTQDLGDGIPIPLVALPDAEKQTGRVGIGGKDPTEFEWDTTGMVQQPLAIDGNRETSNASFRYEPARLLGSSSSSRLVVRPASTAKAPPRAFLDQAKLSSRYLPEKNSLHEAEFNLHATGPLRCRLPNDARLLGLSWNGQPVKHTLRSGELRLETEATPPGAAPSVLRIEFALPEVQLGDGLLLAAPLPDLGLPLCGGVWTLQLPASYQVATFQYLQSIEPKWHERLLMPWRQRTLHRQQSTRYAAAHQAGWREWEIGFAGFVPQEVRIVNLGHRYALAYGIGLAAACLTAWQLVRRSSLLAVLLVVVAISALWLPPTSSFLATAVWLGMLAGIGWKVLAVAFSLQRSAQPETASALRTSPASTTAVLAISLLWTPQRLAAQSPPHPAPEPFVTRNMAQILIPVDDRGAPVGDKHFVPLSFWEELLRQAKNPEATQSGDWVLLKGVYIGELRQSTAGSETSASVWNLAWELNVQRRNARVYLPLVRAEGKWLPTASVDGIPTPLEWNPDGRACSILISQPGPHRVTVRVEPLVRVDAVQANLRLSLPSLLDTQLQLVYPTTLEALELPDDAIPTALDPQRSKVVLPLPHSESLELRWGARPGAAVNAAVWEVEQLELLTITPDGVSLEVRLELQGPGAPPAEVEIAIDSFLQPLDSPEALSDFPNVRDGRRIVSVPIASEPATMETQRATANLRLVLPRHQILGDYRYPEINVIGLTTRSKVAAVALHNRFVQEMVQNPAGDTLDAGQFSELWEDALLTPLVAYQIAGEQAAWTFAVYPRAVATPPEESLLVACGLSGLDVQYQALFAAGGTPIVQQTLQVSPELRVRSVKLGLPTGTETLRTTRPAPDRLVVFFPRPLEEDFRLVLAGEMDWDGSESQAIPTITARPGENLPQRVQIHRRPECLVEISGASAVGSSSDFTLSSPWGAEAYPGLAYFERPDRMAQLRLQIRENQPRATAQSITLFDPTVGVTFVSRIRVSRGLLDRVQLEVPADWIGPLDVSPTAQVVEQSNSAQGRRQVQLQLANSVSEQKEMELRFSGSIAATQDGTWQVPAIRLLGPNPNESWVVVKSEVPATDDAWTLEGVTAAELPSALEQAPNLPPPRQVFRVLPEREMDYVVRYSPAAEQHPFASLSLADVRVREDHSGAQVLTSRFLLPSVASSKLEIDWPEGHEPLGVFVENRHLTPLSIDKQRWELPIGPTDLPILLTAVSRSSPSGSRGKLEIRRPQIWEQGAEYPIPLTLWSIVSRRSVDVDPNSLTGPKTTAEQATFRLARLIQLVNTAEPRLAELSSSERLAWKRVWSARLQSETAILAAAESRSPMVTDPAIVGANDLETRQQLASQATQLLGRLVEPGELAVASESDRIVTISPPSQAAPTGRDTPPLQHFATVGTQSHVVLSAAPQAASNNLPRAVGTAVIVALLGAVLRWAPKFDVAQTIARHPRWLVAGLGILWWTCLTPSTIGLALLLAAVVSWAAERRFRRSEFSSAR